MKNLFESKQSQYCFLKIHILVDDYLNTINKEKFEIIKILKILKLRRNKGIEALCYTYFKNCNKNKFVTLKNIQDNVSMKIQKENVKKKVLSTVKFHSLIKSHLEIIEKQSFLESLVNIIYNFGAVKKSVSHIEKVVSTKHKQGFFENIREMDRKYKLMTNSKTKCRDLYHLSMINAMLSRGYQRKRYNFIIG